MYTSMGIETSSYVFLWFKMCPRLCLTIHALNYLSSTFDSCLSQFASWESVLMLLKNFWYWGDGNVLGKRFVGNSSVSHVRQLN